MIVVDAIHFQDWSPLLGVLMVKAPRLSLQKLPSVETSWIDPGHTSWWGWTEQKRKDHIHWLVDVGDKGLLTPVPHGGTTLEGHPNSSVPYGIIFCCTWTAVQFLPLPKSIPPQILFQRILVNILPARMSPSQSLLHREPTKTKRKIPLDMLREEWLIESNNGYNGLSWTKFIKHLWCSRHCAEHWRYTVKQSWIKQNGSQGTHWPETQTLQQVNIIQRRQALH